MLDRAQHRLRFDDAIGVENILLLAVLLDEFHLLDARRKTLGVAIQVKDPFVDVVVINPFIRRDLVEHSLAVLGQPQLDEGVLCRPLGVAFAQKTQTPDRHARSLERIDPQRGVLDRKRAK